MLMVPFTGQLCGEWGTAEMRSHGASVNVTGFWCELAGLDLKVVGSPRSPPLSFPLLACPLELFGGATEMAQV